MTGASSVVCSSHFRFPCLLSPFGAPCLNTRCACRERERERCCAGSANSNPSIYPSLSPLRCTEQNSWRTVFLSTPSLPNSIACTTHRQQQKRQGPFVIDSNSRTGVWRKALDKNTIKYFRCLPSTFPTFFFFSLHTKPPAVWTL